MKKLRILIIFILLAVFTLSACAPTQFIENIAGAIREAMEAGQSANDGGSESQEEDQFEEAPSASHDGNEQRSFEQYLEELTPYLLDGNDFFTHFYFLDPAAAGLDAESIALTPSSEEDWLLSCELVDEILEELYTFDRSALNAASQLQLDILIDAFERNALLDEDYYYIASGMLGMDSTVANLPMYMSQYAVQDRDDLEALLAIYAELPTLFESYVDLENERQQRGVGMNSRSIELAIEQYKQMIAGDPTPMSQIMAEKINGLDFLTQAEKDEYIAQSDASIEDSFLPAYTYLIDALSGMEGRDPDYGLAGAEGGSEYYAILMQQLVGVDMTPEQALTYIEQQIDKYSAELTALLARPGVYEALVDENYAFTDHDTAEEILSYLEQASRADFPDIGDVPFELQYTPEALRTPGVIAYYIKRPLDQQPGQTAIIYANDDEIAANFMTLAHEGFPGHLYQDTYKLLRGSPYALDIMTSSYIGFTEGWGTYAGMCSADYATNNPQAARAYALNDLIGDLITGYADIVINYEGWSREQFKQRLPQIFEVNTSQLDYIFDMLADDPVFMLGYNIGGPMLLDLRAQAEAALGDSFSVTAFHEVLLETGPTSFSILQKQVDTYIEENTGSGSNGLSGLFAA